jgi:hypothetical protein
MYMYKEREYEILEYWSTSTLLGIHTYIAHNLLPLHNLCNPGVPVLHSTVLYRIRGWSTVQLYWSIGIASSTVIQ